MSLRSKKKMTWGAECDSCIEKNTKCEQDKTKNLKSSGANVLKL